MRIHLASAVQLELPVYPEKGDIEIPEGTTIAGFMDLAGIKKEHQKFVIPMVHATKVNRRYILQEGDHLFLVIPVGGG